MYVQFSCKDSAGACFHPTENPSIVDELLQMAEAAGSRRKKAKNLKEETLEAAV